MYFDREALRGIYGVLSHEEQLELTSLLMKMGCRHDCGVVTDDDLHMAQQAMVELGHIIPFEALAMEAGASEYDEIMLAEKLVEDSISYREG